MMSLRQTALFLPVLLSGTIASHAQDTPAQPTTPMARTADPDFEVATIKPADPDDHSQGFHLNGHRIFIENLTMTSLICYAYKVHKTQLTNAPPWFDQQHWDITGVPDTEGTPSWEQYRHMVQKLLSARFGLQMHPDKRELSVRALTITKGGPKLEKSKSDPDALSDQSGHGMGAQQFMKFTNSSMADFAQTLQLMGDRPVVDQTNLPDRYTFTLLWTPDTLRAAPTDTAPKLSTAVQEQLGLKLEATRTATNVLVIDAATRPTQN